MLFALCFQLFVIEGDYIQLREGAQEMIAATAAVAKVAAAAAVSSPYSSLLPSVAVTPMAQSLRQKKAPSVDPNKQAKAEKAVFKDYAVAPASSTDNSSQLLALQNQQPNGVYFNAGGVFSNVKILSKSKDAGEMNGPEIRPGQPSAFISAGNGVPDRSAVASTQNKASINGRPGAHFVGKQSGRYDIKTLET